MSNVDKALQIMSDYWDAAYCEGNTGINQSANANDCLHRMRQLLAHDVEVVYQVQDSETFGWNDTTKYHYDRAADNRRRLVYTAPPRVVDEAMVFRMACFLAKQDGCDDVHHLIWEGSPPEPWGEVWNKYEDTAREALKAALEKTDAS